MDIIALVKEGLQAVAEHVVSYKMGQTLLRHVDKALWVVEKCARWAVPPPLDPEERPQPELVRPLPWVFFLMLLVALRATRESISLVNLVLGKPPLRSADVVTYIQSKRRYLRTLKYQGNRMMRARIVTVQEPWYSGLRSLFEFTMCFKRQSIPYGNNNTTSVSNNDEVLIVKRSKRVREDDSPVASTSEPTMERLIEKIMVDLDADSNDDSSYTLTNVTSVKSDRSEGTAESDHEEVTNEVSTNSKDTQDVVTTPPKEDSNDKVEPEQNTPPMPVEPKTPTKEHVEPAAEKKTPPKSNEDLALRSFDRRSPILDSKAFLQSEKQPCNQRSPKQKIANGRTVKSMSEKSIGGERRDTAAAVARTASADFTSRGRKETQRQTP
ncbi:jabba isoform X2 [Choristoneura fumiferana]